MTEEQLQKNEQEELASNDGKGEESTNESDKKSYPDWVENAEEAYREIQKLREENKQNRIKLLDFERSVRGLKEDTKQEDQNQETVKKENSEQDALQQMQAIQEKYERDMKLATYKEQIMQTAHKLGFVNLQDAVRNVSLEQIKTNENGVPNNIEELLSGLAKDNPHYIKKTANLSTNNPAGVSTRGEPTERYKAYTGRGSYGGFGRPD